MCVCLLIACFFSVFIDCWQNRLASHKLLGRCSPSSDLSVEIMVAADNDCIQYTEDNMLKL